MSVTTLALSELVDGSSGEGVSAEELDSMQMCVPFTLRGFPLQLNKLKVNNDFACVPFWLRFPKDKQTNKRVFIYQDGKLPKKSQ